MDLQPDDKLFQKYLNNQCTPQEAEQVLEWISGNKGWSFTEDHFQKEISAFSSSDELKPDHEIRSALIYQRILLKTGLASDGKRSATRTRQLYRVKQVAAMVIPLIIGSLFTWVIFLKPSKELSWQELQIPKGEKMQMMFQEGTRAWLNSDSRLKYPLDFKSDTREVELEGEAYFNVKSDPDRPFIVKMKNLTIKVKGTSFNVKSYSGDSTITTTLDNGKITLIADSSGIKRDIILLPGQEAIYSRNNNSVKVLKSEIGQNSTWKNNKLSFRNTPLNEMILTLERWYNVKFVIDDPSIKIYTYTIQFENEKLQVVLDDLEKITPVKCSLINGIVYMTKKRN